MREFTGEAGPVATRLWAPAGPLDLRATLAPLQHGPGDPTLRWTPDGAWRAVRLAAGPATVRLSVVPGTARVVRAGATRQADPRDTRLGGTTRGALIDPRCGDAVRIQAWGDGAEQAVEAAPAWMGCDDDWTDFDAPGFHERLPESVRATRRVRLGLKLPHGGGVLDTLTAIILEQRVTGLEAHYAWARLVTRFGEPAPGHVVVPRSGPGRVPPPAAGAVPPRAGAAVALMLPPTGAAWRAIPSWEWHAARVDASRRNTLVAAAERESAWRRLEAGVPTRPGAVELAALERALRSLPGVGVWTAAETLQRTHGAPDHVSFGDFHVAHLVGQALTGRRVDDAGMERLLAPWAGHRQRVVRLLYASGAKNPSYGPRLAPQDHRRH